MILVYKDREWTIDIIDIVMFCFFGLAFLYYFVSRKFSSLRLIVLLISGSLGWFRFLYNRYITKAIPAYCVLIIISWIICYGFKSSWHIGVTLLICSISYMGLAYNMLDHIHYVKPYEALFLISCLYVLVRIHVLHVPIMRIMQDGTSYNFIGANVLFFLLLLAIVKSQNGQEITISEAFLFLIVTFSAYGRGGMLTGIFIFISAIIMKIRHYNAGIYLFMLWTLLFLFIFLVVYGDVIFSYLYNNTNLLGKFTVQGLSSNGRYDIWKEFLNNNALSVRNILLGSDPFDVRKIDGNLHNSFLQSYAAYGLGFFVCNIILVFYSLFRFFKERNVLLLLFLALVFRASTDKLMWHGLNESVFYYFIFYFIAPNEVN